ncbi:MAG: cytochrome c biogenesis protein CcsA [Myxococcota bacterium]
MSSSTAAAGPAWAPPLWHALAALTVAGVLATLYLTFAVAPVEAQMGIVQKIFYFHVPAAQAMYVGFIAAAVGGLMYLWKRNDAWDAFCVAGAEVGMLFCLIVLVTGPLWGRKAWGAYWVWDPRLTSTLLTGLLYMAFLSLRGSGMAGAIEKRFAAALAVISFPMLFLIKYSVARWAGQHPQVVTGEGQGLAPDMYPALGAGLVFGLLLVGWLLWARYRVERTRQQVGRLEQEAAERGLLEDLY